MVYGQPAVTAFIAAHPVTLALISVVAVGAGSYYLGKRMAEKAAKKSSSELASAPAQEDTAQTEPAT